MGCNGLRWDCWRALVRPLPHRVRQSVSTRKISPSPAPDGGVPRIAGATHKQSGNAQHNGK